MLVNYRRKYVRAYSYAYIFKTISGNTIEIGNESVSLGLDKILLAEEKDSKSTYTQQKHTKKSLVLTILEGDNYDR